MEREILAHSRPQQPSQSPPTRSSVLLFAGMNPVTPPSQITLQDPTTPPPAPPPPPPRDARAEAMVAMSISGELAAAASGLEHVAYHLLYPDPAGRPVVAGSERHRGEHAVDVQDLLSEARAWCDRAADLLEGPPARPSSPSVWPDRPWETAPGYPDDAGTTTTTTTTTTGAYPPRHREHNARPRWRPAPTPDVVATRELVPSRPSFPSSSSSYRAAPSFANSTATTTAALPRSPPPSAGFPSDRRRHHRHRHHHPRPHGDDDDNSSNNHNNNNNNNSNNNADRAPERRRAWEEEEGQYRQPNPAGNNNNNNNNDSSSRGCRARADAPFWLVHSRECRAARGVVHDDGGRLPPLHTLNCCGFACVECRDRRRAMAWGSSSSPSSPHHGSLPNFPLPSSSSSMLDHFLPLPSPSLVSPVQPPPEMPVTSAPGAGPSILAPTPVPAAAAATTPAAMSPWEVRTRAANGLYRSRGWR